MNGLHLILVEWKKDGAHAHQRRYSIDHWSGLYGSFAHCADWYPNENLTHAEMWLKEENYSEPSNAVLLCSWRRP